MLILRSDQCAYQWHPLPVHGADWHGPHVLAVAGQLGDVRCNLTTLVAFTPKEKFKIRTSILFLDARTLFTIRLARYVCMFLNHKTKTILMEMVIFLTPIVVLKHNPLQSTSNGRQIVVQPSWTMLGSTLALAKIYGQIRKEL